MNSLRLEALELSTLPSVDLDRLADTSWTFGGIQDDVEAELPSRAAYMPAMQLSDGRIAVIEPTRVRYFGVDGRELSRIGQAGAGPVEFGELRAGCMTSDTILVVHDAKNDRLGFVHPERGVVVTIPLLRARMSSSACLEGGSAIAYRRITSREDAARYQVLLVDPMLPEPQEIFTLQGTTRPGMIGAGGASIGVIGDRIFAADADVGVIRLYSTAGVLLDSLVWGLPRIAVTDESIRERTAVTMSADSRPEDVAAFWDRLLTAPRATWWPAFADVRADDIGRFWIELAAERKSPTRTWVVTDTLGFMVGMAYTAQGGTSSYHDVVGFADGNVIMLHQDEVGARHLSILGITFGNRPQ
ncbi:MAG: hypothetical protein U0994_05425 [Gemmatimonadales bacterium]|nr:hypothetical protein [Gemmatimonadales bacterium]